VGVEASPSFLTHPALTIKKFLGALPHVRRYFQVVGFAPPNHYLVHNSSISNLARGVLTRVLYVKGKRSPQPPPGIYRQRLSYFRQLVVRGFNSTTPISRQDFVECYRGRKRTIYQLAADSLLTTSINRRDSFVKAFVKAEFINSDDKPDPDPRVISPRDPRYNVEVGKFLRPIEHQVYAVIARIFGDKTVLKGFNAQEIGKIFENKWSSFRDPVAIGLDASRFDQHVSQEALKWEHSVYNAIYSGNLELSKLLRWQLQNKVTGYCKDGKLKYTTDGCRMSGDMNTALGNCLIMCALVHAYAKERGVLMSLANNGDDCVVILERKDESKFVDGLDDWFLEMGFNMKVEPTVDYLEGIEFCQTHPVRVSGQYIMVRNFPKAIAKDCLSLKDMSSVAVCKAWLDAVGQGGLSLTGGIPVYQEFYSSYIRAANGVVLPFRSNRQSSKRRHKNVEIEGGLAWLSKGMNRRYSRVDHETRYSFWLAFGTTPEQQLALEDFYKSTIFQYQIHRELGSRDLPRWF
jgi:hypothetical protein